MSDPIFKSDLAKQLEDALHSDERIGDAGIEVIDNSGVVTLVGHVFSEEQRQAARAIAEGFPGVNSVTVDVELLDTDRNDDGIDETTKGLGIARRDDGRPAAPGQMTATDEHAPIPILPPRTTSGSGTGW